MTEKRSYIIKQWHVDAAYATWCRAGGSYYGFFTYIPELPAEALSIPTGLAINEETYSKLEQLRGEHGYTLAKAAIANHPQTFASYGTIYVVTSHG